MKLRDLLAKLKWKGEDVVIEIIHREGKEELIKPIKLRDITYIGKGHFEFGEDGTYIPFHRIRRILKNNKIIWKRSSA